METPEYTTIAEVSQYLGITAPSESTPAYTEMQNWIRAMSMQADNMANRKLCRTTETSIKYDAHGEEILVIDDCVDITEVTVNDIATEVLEYPTTKPYTSRIAVEGSYFPKGRQNVEVTAIHGMSKTVPYDVNFAVTVLVAGIYNSKEIAGKVGTTEKIGNYSVTYRAGQQSTDFDTAKKSLSSYRRIAL